MSFQIGQQVEVLDEQGVWTLAVIRTADRNTYQVTYPPMKSGNTTAMAVYGYFWWPESRIRSREAQQGAR
jgi:hypothetical protein